MIIIVGLGNPGAKYENTRHNVGFNIVDLLAEELQASFQPQKKFEADVATADIHGEKTLLVKPQTYMNLSGTSVLAIKEFYKVADEQIIIAYDDLDIPLGQIRLRKEGSGGTHNGMKNIISILGTSKIPRLRFGIESRGETAPEQQETTSFVLDTFRAEEEPLLKKTLKKAAIALKLTVEEGIEASMNKYNAE